MTEAIIFFQLQVVIAAGFLADGAAGDPVTFVIGAVLAATAIRRLIHRLR